MTKTEYKKLEDILTDKDYRTSNGTLVVVCDAEFWEKTGIEEEFRQVTPFDFHPDDALYQARDQWITTTEPFCTVTPKEEVKRIRERQEEIFDKISDKTFEECKATFLHKLNYEVPNKKKFLESELERYKAFELPSDLKQGYKRFNKIIPEHLDTGYIDVFGERQNKEPKLIGYDLFGQWLEKYQLSNEAVPRVDTSTESKEKQKEGLTFDSLFSDTDISKKTFVMRAMKDLQIINENGISILAVKEKVRLLGFIYAIRQKRYIPNKADTLLTDLFAKEIRLDCKRLRPESSLFDRSKEEALSYINTKEATNAIGR